MKMGSGWARELGGELNSGAGDCCSQDSGGQGLFTCYFSGSRLPGPFPVTAGVCVFSCNCVGMPVSVCLRPWVVCDYLCVSPHAHGSCISEGLRVKGWSVAVCHHGSVCARVYSLWVSGLGNGCVSG